MKNNITTIELIELCKIYGMSEKYMMRLLKLREENQTDQTKDFYLGIGG